MLIKGFVGNSGEWCAAAPGGYHGQGRLEVPSSGSVVRILKYMPYFDLHYKP